jgi:short-chain Z-isoprenyl diphosphate synthase
VIEWCDEAEIPLVTLWGLSTDNLRRPKAELDMLYHVIGDALDELGPEAQAKHRRHVRAIGRIELLPPALQEKIHALEASTAQHGPWGLNIAVAYGGRDELIDAFRRYLSEAAATGASPAEIAEHLDAGEIRKCLYVPDAPEPDLIIRTSGEARLSGFLLWQSVYSEIYFCDTLWPAFRKLDFLRAIRSFQSRHRRFGL